MQVTILLADENAKVNLNAACRVHGPGEANRLVRALASDRHLPPVRLRPALDKDDPPTFHSWGQIFALDQARRNADVPLSLMRATANMTCWGSGKLDPHRASDDAVKYLCGRVIGPRDVDRLQEMRRKNPKYTAEQMIQGLALRQSEAEQLGELLGKGPSCRSLWLVVTTERRSYYELCVLESRTSAKTELARDGNPANTPENGREREKEHTVTYRFVW